MPNKTLWTFQQTNVSGSCLVPWTSLGLSDDNKTTTDWVGDQGPSAWWENMWLERDWMVLLLPRMVCGGTERKWKAHALMWFNDSRRTTVCFLVAAKGRKPAVKGFVHHGHGLHMWLERDWISNTWLGGGSNVYECVYVYVSMCMHVMRCNDIYGILVEASFGLSSKITKTRRQDD